MVCQWSFTVTTVSRNCCPGLMECWEDNEGYFKANGEPLFSSHMLDLSEEFDEENLATHAKYFRGWQ